MRETKSNKQRYTLRLFIVHGYLPVYIDANFNYWHYKPIFTAVVY